MLAPSATTSGPMPSPGRTATVSERTRGEEVRPSARADARRMRGFVGGDRYIFPEQKSELVDPVQQTVSGKRIDRERVRRSVGQRRALRGEIDGHPCARRFRQLVDEACIRSGSKGDWEQAVLERVVPEDIGEAGADDGAEAEVEQCPWRVLARRAAAKVVAGDEDRCINRDRRIKGKVNTRLSALIDSPVSEEMRAQSAALDRLEKARRNDLIGVYVFGRQHDAGRRERREWLHRCRRHDRLRT